MKKKNAPSEKISIHCDIHMYLAIPCYLGGIQQLRGSNVTQF